MTASPVPPESQAPPLSVEEAGRLNDILLRCHRGRRLITYARLAEEAEIGAPHRIHKLTLWLEATMLADHRAGKPLRATAAVSRAGRNLPGRGFFLLLAELGRCDDAQQDEAQLFAKELGMAQAFWGEKGRAES